MRALPWLALLVLGCTDDVGIVKVPVDADNDGYDVEADCDDARQDVNPTAPERCDGIDNDCDGALDEDPTDAPSWYADADADGYGDEAASTAACEAPEGHVADATDCDDADPAVFPGADEPDCTDPVDYDCDGTTAYADADRDGAAACEDCDDTDPARSPFATEVCDPDDVDEDCDGLADDADEAAGTTIWWRDRDDDGWGDAGSATLEQCNAPDGYTAGEGDCDDYDASVNPAAAEVCDALDVDEDCDGLADDADPTADAAGFATWYRDDDGDTWGDDAATVRQCDEPTGFVDRGGDCDEADASVSPDGTEVCGGADEDCDTLVDDDDPTVTSTSAWYPDADGDGYGAASSATDACLAPAGHVASDDDCDDTSASISPAATEVCDAADTDEDCDGLADDADASVDGATYTTRYTDADRDGYGDADAVVQACDPGAATVADATDCDDADAAVNPGEIEVCAAGDEDCDGLEGDDDPSLDGSTRSTWYADLDGDGFGDAGAAATACEAPTDHVTDTTDCDDADDAVFPGAPDTCGDAVDSDCDGDAACALTVDDADRQLRGAASGNQLGYGLAGAGDPNGDGYDDVVLGASEATLGGTSAGAAYVVNGGAAGDLVVSAAAAVLVGENAGDYAGYCTEYGGDLDGDGIDDVLVAAHYNDEGATNAGKVYVLDGPVASMDLSAAADGLLGEDANDRAGNAVAGGEDVSGDGRADLLVAAVNRGSGAGAVYLVTALPGRTIDLSSATARLSGEAAGDAAGYAADLVGDLDADGYTDLGVGAPVASGLAGKLYVVNGPESGSASLATADAILTGTGTDRLGGSVRAAGDVDGDGYDDLLVGTVQDDDVWLVSGPISGTSPVRSVATATFSSSASIRFGYSLDGGGDVDGDGTPDLVVGAEWYSSYAGAAYVYFGPFSGSYTTTDATLAITSTAGGDYFGSKVRFVGDHDGDGRDDFGVSAWGEDDGGSNAGAVWLFLTTGL